MFRHPTLHPCRGWLLLNFALLSGCAGSYGCKGFPNFPTCLSAVQAYQATNGSVTANPNIEPSKPTLEHSMARGVRENPIDPPGQLNDPNPIRTPPKVMRIWIAPWEDSDGDLQVSSYVYTELEPRRWMMGVPAHPATPILTPLQVAHRDRPSAHATPLATGLSDKPTTPGEQEEN